MDPAEILRQLTHEEGLPRAALQAAAQQRATMVPLFIEEIERYLSAGAGRRDTPTPLFFIFHLLGDWREQAAYVPLARLLRCGTEDVEFVLGGAITETTNRVMAAVFAGDPQPLYDIILDPDADEYVRAGMFEALVMLTLDGRLPRDGTGEFLRDCASRLRPQGDCYAWVGWQEAIAHLGLSEMTPLVRRAFDEQWVHPSIMDFKHFEQDLQYALDHPDDPIEPRSRHTLFGDTITELSGWYAFSDEYAKNRRKARRQSQSVPSLAPGQPVVNPFRRVGRNDPCPCGSGKKFKKCCLQ